MKTILKLFAALFIFVCFFACTTDELQEETSTNKLTEENTSISLSGPMNSFGIETDDDESKEIDLENRMQWISYITAQAIMRSNDAKQQFENEVTNSGSAKAFQIANLLDDNVLDSSFKDEFRDVFYLYYDSEFSCTGNGKPKGGPTPPSPIGGTAPGTIPPTPFELYVSSILYDDCFEFYLPNGFSPLAAMNGSSTGGAVFLRSTAHPLTNASSNEGYYHSNTNTSNCSVTEITANDNTGGPLIVIRPVITNSSQCTYDKYSVNNYEEFLD